MNTGLIGLIVAVIGFVTMILKWWFNPRRKLTVEYDRLTEEWDNLQDDLGPALLTHDNDKLVRIKQRVEEILKERKKIAGRLKALGVSITISLMVFLTGCATKNVYFNESEKIICDKAATGACVNFTYDCCVMGYGDCKSLLSVNPTIKEIKVLDCGECQTR